MDLFRSFLIAILLIKSHIQADESNNLELTEANTQRILESINRSIDYVRKEQREIKEEIKKLSRTIEDINERLQEGTLHRHEKSTSRVTAVEELPMEDVAKSMKMYILCENQKIIDNFKKKSDEVVSLLNATNLKEYFDTFQKEIKQSLTKNEEKLNKLTALVGDPKVNGNITPVPPKLPPSLTGNVCTAASKNGVYRLEADFGSYSAYCMRNKDDGKSWTIIQRRLNGFIDFNRSWEEYKNGFGDPNGDYWLGLEKIHALTSKKPHMFWFEMRGSNGFRRYSKYTRFEIGSEEEGYNLKKVEQYSGTFDNMFPNPGADNKFVTRDKNQDVNICGKNAMNWWAKSCRFRYLNGPFGSVRDSFGPFQINVFMAIRAVSS